MVYFIKYFQHSSFVEDVAELLKTHMLVAVNVGLLLKWGFDEESLTGFSVTCTISCNSSSLKLTPILQMLKMKARWVLHSIYCNLLGQDKLDFRGWHKPIPILKKETFFSRSNIREKSELALIETMMTLSKTLKTCFRSSWVSFSASLLIISSTNSWKRTKVRYFYKDIQEAIAWQADVTVWANIRADI